MIIYIYELVKNVNERTKEMGEKQLDIKEIQRVLKKRWKLISIITIILTLFTGLMSYFVITPQYQSSTKLFIGKAQSDATNYNANDIQIYQKLLKTYSELITTNDLIAKAIDKDNINAPVSMVLNGLSVEPKTDTQILDISFKSSDAVLSKEVLDAVTKEFVSEAEELIPNVTVKVKIMQASNLSAYPVSPNIPKNIVLGFIVGFALGIALAFWLEFLDNTFKTKEQLEEIIGIPVIGLIPIEII